MGTVQGGLDQPQQGEHVAENKKPMVRIQLTADQKAQIQKATGKKADALELTAEELEERIAPMSPMTFTKPIDVSSPKL